MMGRREFGLAGMSSPTLPGPGCDCPRARSGINRMIPATTHTCAAECGTCQRQFDSMRCPLGESSGLG